jgi:hypothetical protein
MKIEIIRTSRYPYEGQFEDTLSAPCAISDDTIGNRLWLGTAGEPMRLSRDHCAALWPLLKAFAETGRLPEPR